MALKLVILEGVRKGEEFVVKDDIVIGRSRGDLTLRDAKASNPHAKIVLSSKNSYQIEDLNSSNGTFVNGTRISKVTINLKDRIKIGNSILCLDVLAPTKKGPIFEANSWQEKVGDALIAVKELKGDTRFLPFKLPLCLEVIQGLQAGERFFFGFGPRSVGSSCPDGLIMDSKCPERAFEVHPGNDSTPWVLKNVDSAIRLNDQPITAANSFLKAGDRISFGTTILEVKVHE